MVARNCSSGSTSFVWNSLRATADPQPTNRLRVLLYAATRIAVRPSGQMSSTSTAETLRAASTRWARSESACERRSTSG